MYVDIMMVFNEFYVLFLYNQQPFSWVLSSFCFLALHFETIAQEKTSVVMLGVMLATCVIYQFYSTHIPVETIEMTLVGEGRCPYL